MKYFDYIENKNKMKKLIFFFTTAICLTAAASTQKHRPVNTPELLDNRKETVYTGKVGNNEFIFDSPFTTPVLSYKIYSSGDMPKHDPANWTLKGSNNGKKWTIVDERKAQIFCSRYQEILCMVQKPAVYKQYLLEAVTAGKDTLKIAEVVLSDKNLLAGWENFRYPEVRFRALNSETEGNRIYTQLVQDPDKYVKYHTQKVAEILFYTADEPMNDVRRINYVLKDYNGISEKSGNPPSVSIVYSTRWVETSAKESLYKLDYETRGVLYHELTHAYQFEPKGIGTYSTNKEFWACIEGIADAVRAEAGLFDISTRKPGGHWLTGYRTTGFFIQWLTTKTPDAIRKFHHTVRDLDVWSFDNAIKSIFGNTASIEDMWKEYQEYLRSL